MALLSRGTVSNRPVVKPQEKFKPLKIVKNEINNFLSQVQCWNLKNGSDRIQCPLTLGFSVRDVFDDKEVKKTQNILTFIVRDIFHHKIQ